MEVKLPSRIKIKDVTMVDEFEKSLEKSIGFDHTDTWSDIGIDSDYVKKVFGELKKLKGKKTGLELPELIDFNKKYENSVCGIYSTISGDPEVLDPYGIALCPFITSTSPDKAVSMITGPMIGKITYIPA